MLYPGDLILDRYEVLSYSSASMNLVFTLEDQITGELLFAKTYKKDSPKKDLLIQKFKDELRFSLTMGNHPNILSVRFLEKINGQLFLVTDYIPEQEKGNNLEKRILAGLTFKEIIDFAYQITEGMEFLNLKKEFAHLDLKPANILVTEKNIIKICDFGLARNVDPLYFQPSKEQAGTLVYKSGEHFNHHIIDTRSDVYSFGIIFYQMLTGKFPFEIPERFSSEKERLDFFHNFHRNNDLGKELYWKGDSLLKEATGDQLWNNGTFDGYFVSLGQLLGGCLAKEPRDRYYRFSYIREALDNIFPQYKRVKEEKETASDTQSFLAKGLDYQKMDDHKKALNYFNKALRKDPDNASIWFAVALSNWAESNQEQAINYLKKAISLAPEEKNYQEQLELFYYQMTDK